jgi:hypothetical protein
MRNSKWPYDRVNGEIGTIRGEEAEWRWHFMGIEHSFHTICLHWLGDSRFSAQFMVKNVVCFSDIFH